MAMTTLHANTVVLREANPLQIYNCVRNTCMYRSLRSSVRSIHYSSLNLLYRVSHPSNYANKLIDFLLSTPYAIVPAQLFAKHFLG